MLFLLNTNFLIGAHDLDSMNEDFYIRYSVNEDTFLPFVKSEI